MASSSDPYESPASSSSSAPAPSERSASEPGASESGASESGASEAAASGWTTRRVVGSLLAVLVLTGLAIPKLLESNPQAASGSQGPQAQSVDAVVVRPTSITERLQTTGTLRADESVELTAETSGKVTSIRFEEGERVAAGDLLVTINDDELQAERTRLQRQLELAQKQKQRQERLLSQDAVSEEEYDQTVNRVQTLQADLELVEARIAKTRIRAPFGGTIGLRAISPGSYLSPQTRIATLQRTDPIKLDLSVPEKYAGRVGPGTTVRFTVRSADRTFEGTVYAVEPQVNASTRTLQLRARASNPDGALRPGAFAEVDVVLGQTDDAIVVPSFAVIPALGAQRVFVADGGTAEPRSVEVGVRTDSTVQITDGLAPGDTVITSAIQELRAGLPIQLANVEG
jgi:membrane fusion protein (multidrug efflux system)